MEPVFETSWLIIGLGNPGPEYERTRHNLGFMVVDLLAREEATAVKRSECRSMVGRTSIGGRPVELVKPQTFMNLSGEAAACLLKKPERDVERLIVVSDDLALPFGKIRLRSKGSHGGHNGLRSIIECLGRNDFVRLRIGIQPEHPVREARNFVLQDFAQAEAVELEKILKISADAVRDVVSTGIDMAMAKWNSEPAMKAEGRETKV
jgi:PTH1 family peptidyl-tRNA hydrolase